jgi:hypothetical protein
MLAKQARIGPEIRCQAPSQAVPVDSDDKKAKVRAARAKVNSKHSKAFKKLAE